MLTVLRLLLGAMKLIIMTVFIGIMIIAFFYIPYSARTQRANSIAVIKFWGSVFSPVIMIKECGRFFWPILNFFHRRKMVLILTLKKIRLFSCVFFFIVFSQFCHFLLPVEKLFSQGNLKKAFVKYFAENIEISHGHIYRYIG